MREPQLVVPSSPYSADLILFLLGDPLFRLCRVPGGLWAYRVSITLNYRARERMIS